MLIGERAAFAVECTVLSGTDGGPLYGVLCYWVAGVKVGDLKQERFLYSIVPFLKTVVANQGRRPPRPGLSGDVRAMLTLVRDRLYGSSGRVPGASDAGTFEPYVVTPNDETFDGFLGILVERGDRETLCWSDDRGHSGSADLPNGELGRVAGLFTEWLESCRIAGDADELMARAVPDKRGRRWYTRDSDGSYLVFERGESGKPRYAFRIEASRVVGTVPRFIIERFDDPK
jgi:hypothetical protein